MLTKGQLIDQICEVLEEDGVTLPRRNVKDALEGLAVVAQEQIEAGDDFTIPGVAKLFFTYRAPKKKGERWKKGDEVTGFGGITETKDSDSPPVKAAIKLKAQPTGLVNKLKPGSKPEAQAAFLKTPAGKAVVKRKGK